MSARGTGSKPDLVDQAALAERLGVSGATVSRWYRRSVLPPPDLEVGPTELWLWENVHGWAGQRSRSLQSRKTRTDGRFVADIVDLSALAERLGVSGRTAANWQRSGLLPEPDYRWQTTNAWLWETIDRWSTAMAGRVSGLVRPGDVASQSRHEEPSGPRLSVTEQPPSEPATVAAPPAAVRVASVPADPGPNPGERPPLGGAIRPVSNPKTPPPAGEVTPARERSADPIGDIDRIYRYFAGVAESLRAVSQDS